MLAICWFLNLCYQEDLQQTSVFSSKTWFGTTYGKDIVLLSTIQLWSNFFVFWTCFSSSIRLIVDKELTLLISIHILLTMTLSQHCQILQYSSCFPQQSLLQTYNSVFTRVRFKKERCMFSNSLFFLLNSQKKKQRWFTWDKEDTKSILRRHQFLTVPSCVTILGLS